MAYDDKFFGHTYHKLHRLVLLEYGCDFLMIFQLMVYEVLKSIYIYIYINLHIYINLTNKHNEP